MITVSCVIPTLKEEKNIAQLLESIKDQEFDEDIILNDIVIIDNGSKDNTISIARNLGARVLIKPELTIGGLRNYGAETCSGDIIFFLDADNILSEHVINNIVRKYVQLDCGAIGVRLRPYNIETWVQETWSYHLNNNVTGIRRVKAIGSGAFAIKRDLFYEIGGFNEDLISGEDTDLSRRINKLGYPIYLDAEEVVYNTGFPRTLWDFVKREVWHGDSINSLILHKKIDLLTLYIFLSLGMLMLGILSCLGVFSRRFLLLSFAVITMPSTIKSFSKRKKIDLMYLKLNILYVIYILCRTLSLLKMSKKSVRSVP